MPFRKPRTSHAVSESAADAQEGHAGREDRRASRQRRALIAIVILLIVLLCGIIAAFVTLSAPLEPEVTVDQDTLGWTFQRSIMSWGGAEEQSLLRPAGAVFMEDGSLWVGDAQGGPRLLHFPAGATIPDVVISGLFGTEPGQLNGMWDIDRDNEGNLYLPDGLNNRVQVYTPEGERLREFDARNPESICVDGDIVYVGETGSIARFTLEGDLLSRWGEFGREDDQYDQITGLDIADGTLFVADGALNRVKAVDAETGEVKWVVGTAPTSMNDTERAFDFAADVMYTEWGLYVLEGLGSEVQILDPETGEMLKTFSERGSEDGQLLMPRGLALDGTGRIAAVTDQFNNRVQFILLDEETILDQTTGGGGILSALSAGRGWSWCCLPLGLLLLLLLIPVVLSRWRSEAPKAESTDADESGQALVDTDSDS